MGKRILMASVEENRLIGPRVWLLRLHTPILAAAARPGQFFHVRVRSGLEPLLRRPLSIADVDSAKGTVTLIYRVVGKGTALLARLQPGDLLDVMGPLGNGFVLYGSKPLLIGGGMGIAPLLYLARALCPTPATVIMGGRTKDEMFWPELFRMVCDKVHVSTDDGSLGQKGFALDVWKNMPGDYDSIYVCGPHAMLKSVAEYSMEKNIPCQVSLEEYMACGVGACLSCTCEMKDGKRRKVCTDGPVFSAEEVLV